MLGSSGQGCLLPHQPSSLCAHSSVPQKATLMPLGYQQLFLSLQELQVLLLVPNFIWLVPWAQSVTRSARDYQVQLPVRNPIRANKVPEPPASHPSAGSISAPGASLPSLSLQEVRSPRRSKAQLRSLSKARKLPEPQVLAGSAAGAGKPHGDLL